MANKLSPRQATFVNEYIIDSNATQAAIRAGYSEKTAGQHASRLLKDVKIQAAMQERQKELAKASQITQEFVLNGLRENYERAMQLIKVPGTDGAPSGEYKYDGSVANKALELLGKHLAMFTERVEMESHNYVVSSEAMSEDAWLDTNERKDLHDEQIH